MSKAEILADIARQLERLNRAVEALAPTGEMPPVALGTADAYHWDPEMPALRAVERVNRVPLGLLRGIDDVRDILLQNTRQFARGHGANNVLLWGAKGMGKSSLVKAVHAEIAAESGHQRLVLVEINREDISSLPRLMRVLSEVQAQVILFCDDLSFDHDGADYKSLKSILDGGLEGRPHNVIFYATSNRRHLMPRVMIDNERSSAINPHEAVDEKVSLSDRFGLWLGFHNCSQDEFLEMIAAYCEHFGIDVPPEEQRARAIEWAQTRGARSGRVAIQLARQLAGEKGQALS